ncbi:MAG: DUF2490 domain-containing protein [Myxococcales bacterium]|nr:MAG: DUF2490 domain-containing protein [Myxococcales bacterium]
MSFSIPTLAQAESDYQNWLTLEGLSELSPQARRWLLYGLLQTRRGGMGTVSVVRAAAGLRLSEETNMMVGGDWLATLADRGGAEAHEHRLWQQFQVSFEWPYQLQLGLRTRVEERFSPDDSGVGIRLRQRVRLVWDFEHLPSAFSAFSVEAFFAMNDNTWSQQAGFDQIRLYGAIGYHFTNELRAEIGYQLLAQEENSSVFFSQYSRFLALE